MKWAYLVGAMAAVALSATLLSAPVALAGTRTVSWGPVTTYTDNTEIEAWNLPILYDVWYVDSVTATRTDVCVKCSTTSSTFSDALMISGRLYYFYGKAFAQDGAASEDSPGYDWTVPFRFLLGGGSLSGGVMH